MDITVQAAFRNEERLQVSFKMSRTKMAKSDIAFSDMKVAHNSEPATVAGAIASKVREGERVSMLCVGAGAVLQTIKAISMARRFLDKDGYDLSFRPEFFHLTMEDGDRSGIRFYVLAQQV